MKYLSYLPTFFVLLVIYNIVALFGTDLTQPLFSMHLISGADLLFSRSDLFMVLGVIFLYIELVKSTRTSSASTVELSFSVLVFVLFLIELITIKSAGTSTFLILTLMSLLDVLAGFTISISSVRRDINIGGN